MHDKSCLFYLIKAQWCLGGEQMCAQGASPTPGVPGSLACKSVSAGVIRWPTVFLKKKSSLHVVSQNKVAKYSHNSQMARGGEL